MGLFWTARLDPAAPFFGFRTALNAFGIRTPLLLILAALAHAGAADDRSGSWRDTVGRGESSVQPATVGFEIVAMREFPTPLGVSLAASHEIDAPVQGNRPPRGSFRIPLPYSAGTLQLQIEQGTHALHAISRSRLAFAHHAAMSRSGAYSSFGTSLPPPLLS